MPTHQTILRDIFGYTEYRQGQQALIEALLSGRDAFGVMPTGAGKSLCYQIPALLLPGVSLVVSPLISLMKDQVNALSQNGVEAAFINSTLTAGQYRAAMQRAGEGAYKIIYVAPERLLNEDFIAWARAADIAMVAVDEAHCISQWGQDFRPSYLRIPEFIALLAKRPILGAFTATATNRVQEDVTRLLGLADPLVAATGFDRPNLYYAVQYPADKYASLRRFLAEAPEDGGIVYCSTRKAVEEVCARLQREGHAATRYHAGLSPEERKANQDAFLRDEATLMVATNAFGMGIDKSNVRFVVHYNMPKNLESYYQEAGRAGRDGLAARCLLLYSDKDIATQQFFISRTAAENDEMDEAAKSEFQRIEQQKLAEMRHYCHTTGCLRGVILRYFGEEADGPCHNCHNCLHQAEAVDITVEAQKILSCVKRMGERFGASLVIDVLRGAKTERIHQLGFDALSTYGIMAATSKQHLQEMLRYLTQQRCLAVEGDSYPVLALGPAASEVLFGGKTLELALSDKPETLSKTRKKAKKSILAEGGDEALFEKLRALRTQLAQREKVPAYVVFSDSALLHMCQLLPTTLDAFSEVSGVGQKKLARYGEAFLGVIRAHTGQ